MLDARRVSSFDAICSRRVGIDFICHCTDSEDVLQAEEKVGVILRQAREKGSEIRRSAENEISERMNEAKQKGREIVQTTVEDAKKDAERISAEKLEQADREKDAMLNDRTDVIDGLVTDICNLVMTEGR
jgi:vacuolar-type H+-ATPase subunit H